MTDPLIGKKIGQYEIQSLIGQGGMAVVYRAHQGSMKRDVAMKIVSSPITLDPAFMERFKREHRYSPTSNMPILSRYTTTGRQRKATPIW
jgi:serine/threonine protein kinase